MDVTAKPLPKSVGGWVQQAIDELEPCVNASCKNELAMRTVMALVRLSNAFMDAGLGPLEMIVPAEGGAGEAIEQVLMSWRGGNGPRQRIMLGADRVA